MAKKIVGLKLGASRLTAACLSVNGSVEVVQLADSPLPAGLIAGGEVRDAEALGEALKKFFGKHKLPKRNVRIGVANNRIGVRTIEVAGIEMIADAEGGTWVYDVNTNTNYNPDAEAAAVDLVNGARVIGSSYLSREKKSTFPGAPPVARNQCRTLGLSTSVTPGSNRTRSRASCSQASPRPSRTVIVSM